MTVSPSEHDPLDALAEAFLEELRGGGHPSVAEYARRHADLAEQIHELFPALLALEGMPVGHGKAQGRPGTGHVPGRLGEYRLVREVGRGGMGVVYEAVQEALELRRALGLLEDLLREFPRSLESREQMVNALLELGQASKRQGANDVAEKFYGRALPLLEQLAAQQPERFDLRVQRASVQAKRGELQHHLKRGPEAEKAYRATLALERQLAPEADAQPRHKTAWIEFAYQLGALALVRGDRKEARRLFEEALRGQLALPADERPPNHAAQLRVEYSQLVYLLLQLGEHSEAARRAHELTRHFPNGLREHITAGGCLLRCALTAAKDKRLPQEQREALARSYAERGAETLRAAVGKGDRDPSKVRRSIRQALQAMSNSAVLRAYPSVQQLLKDLEEETP